MILCRTYLIRFFISLFFLFVIALYACSGGDDGVDTKPPQVYQTTPLSAEADVAEDIEIIVRFNERMQAISIDSASILLAQNGVLVPGTVTFAGVAGVTRVASFVPDKHLVLGAEYTVTVTTGAMDLAGNGLGSDYHWSFTVRDGKWGTPELIETNDAGDASNVQIVTDGEGNAIALWYQSDGTHLSIWSNRYEVGVGWGSAELIGVNDAGDATNFTIVTDGSGYAHVVWLQSDGIRDNLWSNCYVAGVGWGSAELIETNDAGDASNVQIVTDGEGNALAVWEQFDGTFWKIWSNRYVVGVGWGSAELIETDNGGSARYPQIAINSTGSSMVVWKHVESDQESFLSNRYVAGHGWEGPVLINSEDYGILHDARIVMDDVGNALAVWQEWTPKARLWSSRYVAGVGWGSAELIDSGNSYHHTYSPHVVMDGAGNVMVVWKAFLSISDLGEYNGIWSNRYTADIGWGKAELIGDGDNSTLYQIAMDDAGNTLALWNAWDTPQQRKRAIWSRWYLTGVGWNDAELFGIHDEYYVSSARIAVDGAGNAFAVWIFNKSYLMQNWIWSNRYVAGVGWTGGDQISKNGTGEAYRPQIVTDGKGRALTVWEELDGTHKSIWSSRFD